jgi:hypothetical protein
MAFTYRLEKEDGTPADPPMLHTVERGTPAPPFCWAETRPSASSKSGPGVMRTTTPC